MHIVYVFVNTSRYYLDKLYLVAILDLNLHNLCKMFFFMSMFSLLFNTVHVSVSSNTNKTIYSRICITIIAKTE